MKFLIILLLMFSISLIAFSVFYVGVWGGSVDRLLYFITNPTIITAKTYNWLEMQLLDIKIERFLRNKKFPISKMNSIASNRLKEATLKPVQPILVIVDENAENKFGRYLGEILLSEGLNEFQVATLSNVTSDVLKAFDLVILAQAKLTDIQLTNFEQYVMNGGSLLALKPDKKLSTLCGLTSTSDTLQGGYIKLQNDFSLAKKLVNESIQYHGVADIYQPNGAEIIAFLYPHPDQRSTLPAITRKRFRRGIVVCFTYDLASNVVYMRQGNPSLAGKDTDGLPGIRPNDMFHDLIDVNRDWIPQADIHQHILSNLILELTEIKKPLPRWYPLPDNSKALLIMTGDGCGGSKSEDFHQMIGDVESFAGTISFYYFFDFNTNTLISPEENRDWLTRGHNTSVHPFFPVEISKAEEVIEHDLVKYRLYYGVWPKTIRTHGLCWIGYVDQARLYERVGVRMDLTYVSYLPGMDGYMSGSAFPMRFIDTTGSIFNVYQQPTQFEDDIQMGSRFGYAKRQGLTTKQATERSVEMLRQSIERFHEPVVMNMHPFLYVKHSGEWARNTMAYAKENGIPIYSAERWLAFWEAKEQAEFTKITFRRNVLSFNIQGKGPVKGITFMIPLKSGSNMMRSLYMDNKLQPFLVDSVWGKDYALAKINLGPGKVVEIDAIYR